MEIKATFKRWVRRALLSMARRRLKTISPQMVGVTGSVGKTSTKEAMVAVLDRQYQVHSSSKGYNTDFGISLSILNQPSGYNSPLKWARILPKAWLESRKQDKPYEIFVAEMGIDAPGGMDEILELITPQVMVFLNVKDVHRDEGQFPNREAIFQEKAKACLAVPETGWVILNQDDPYTQQLKGKTKAATVTIGLSAQSDLQAVDIQSGPKGLQFTLKYEGQEVPFRLPHLLGSAHIHGILAAIAVGFVMGIPVEEISNALEGFRLPPGRMNRIEGKNGSTLIDSSYNASPDSMEAALEVLSEFPGRKIAALGSMNELGELSDSAHIKIGKLAGEQGNMLIAVGEKAKEMAEGARQAGLDSSRIHVFASSKEAGRFLSELLEPGDTVLVKGSQNKVRMEHVTKACMKHPEEAGKLLVRQDSYWLAHP